ncbi:TetR/AcrR family transcriptional regulator [Phenylobacterium sp.]|uniref:TetR/AcrR family transcriptional regulator n=1 Tax=Phenylobacterium sp. TaxID=1871053 RepID=UPI001216EBF9|nr:TetR/AcrR family transcriptional regulator [Phenylobacterium sp.]THD60472.1 MAG: TetR/AcrR family transcriptional regulator [Phenylobacterium sp.]
MNEAGPRWRRRKEARPAEMIEAALDVFAEHGFAAAKLDDIARRAGVAKGSLYLYFDTKEALFRAVVEQIIAPAVSRVLAMAQIPEEGPQNGPFAEVAPRLLAGAALALSQDRVAAVARMVIGEARTFPDLARVWHDQVVGPLLSAVAARIARAQAAGEVRPGSPRTHAFSLVGPLLMATLYRQVFAGVDADPPDLAQVAAQHAQSLLQGLILPATPPAKELPDD